MLGRPVEDERNSIRQPMAKRSPDPIPNYLREAYSEAVELFSKCNPAALSVKSASAKDGLQ
jgi:hypothetical protein